MFFATQKLPIFSRIRGADCTFNSCYTATTLEGEVAKTLDIARFSPQFLHPLIAA